MIVESLYFSDEKWMIEERNNTILGDIQIVFVFGDLEVLKKYNHFQLLRTIYPNAHNEKTSLILTVSCAARHSILKHFVNEEIKPIAQPYMKINQCIND